MTRDTRVLKLVYRKFEPPGPRQGFKAWVRWAAKRGGDDLQRLARGWIGRKGLQS